MTWDVPKADLLHMDFGYGRLMLSLPEEGDGVHIFAAVYN